MNIFDTAKSQFTIPSSVISLSPPSQTQTHSRTHSIHTNNSHLVINFDTSPFAFWITRRTDASQSPDTSALPLFDTRISSLPKTPVSSVNANGTLVDLEGFPLVFEDQYLQVASALPKGTNIYGLGEILSSSGFRRDIGEREGEGTIQAVWARDEASPIDQNM